MSSLSDAFEKRITRITSLTLGDLPFTAEIIDSLIPVLPALTTLSFAHCEMGQNVVTHLFQAMKRASILTKSLISLDISHNTLGPEGSTALAGWLTNCLPSNLASLNLASTNPVWPILVTALQKREIGVRQLNMSENTIYDKVFCVLNPFIAGGHVVSLGVGAMKGDMTMVEGLCGSLLLNPNLKATSLILDNTPMDCRLVSRLPCRSSPGADYLARRPVGVPGGAVAEELSYGRRLRQHALRRPRQVPELQAP